MRLVVAALIVQNGKLLACQRTRHQNMALKWEFPGGKVEVGEEKRAALRRELDEELGIEAEIGSEVAHVRHHYRNGFGVELYFYLVTAYKGSIQNKIFNDIRWTVPSELAELDFLDADRPLVADLARGKLLPELQNHTPLPDQLTPPDSCP